MVSNKQLIEKSLKRKLRRAKTMSKGNVNPDFDIEHPDWVRDNATPTHMIKQIKEKFEKEIKQNEQRRNRHAQ